MECQTPQTASRSSARRSGGAVRRAGVQDDDRSVRRQALHLPHNFGHAPTDATCSTRRAKPRSASASCCASRARSSRRSQSAIAGEIVAVAKLKDTTTGDTLCDEKSVLVMPPLTRPNGVISFAIRPKTKGDEEKSSPALQKLIEEDPRSRCIAIRRLTTSFCRAPARCISKSRSRSCGASSTSTSSCRRPRFRTRKRSRDAPRRRASTSASPAAAANTAIAGLKIEPMPRGKGFEFVDNIVGGVIPRNFIPSVEKGVRNTLPDGFLAGYPMVDVRVTVFDGSYHDVDSSDMAFQIAASMGFKALRKSPANHPRTDRRDRSRVSRRMHGRRDWRSELAPRQGSRDG